MKPPPYLPPLSKTKQGNPQSRDQGRGGWRAERGFLPSKARNPTPTRERTTKETRLPTQPARGGRSPGRKRAGRGAKASRERRGKNSPQISPEPRTNRIPFVLSGDKSPSHRGVLRHPLWVKCELRTKKGVKNYTKWQKREQKQAKKAKKLHKTEKKVLS